MDNFEIYLNQIRKYKVLDKEREQEYFKAIEHNRGKIVEHNLKLVVAIAIEIHKAWDNTEVMDLIQEGNIALLTATGGFKFKKNFRFSTYASYVIRNEMMRYIKGEGLIRKNTTKSQRVVINNIQEIKTRLEDSGMTLDEVAEKFDVDKMDILDATNIAKFVSYNDPSVQSDLIDHETPESTYLKNEARLNLRRKIKEFRSGLTGDEAFIWDNRILEKVCTLSECGGHPMTVKRLEDRVIAKAKEYFSLLDFYDIIGD
jgi:RNA polymerase primary sigma factor